MKKLFVFLLLFLFLFAINACSSSKKSNTNNKSPIAGFQKVISGLTVNFDASTSSDPDGTISNFNWTFGNGQTGNGVKVSHTYKKAGTFEVKLTVTDNDNSTATSSQNVTVTKSGNGNPNNQPPIASFQKAISDLTVSFDASTSNDPDGTISNFNWTFGDGQNGNGVKVSHTYQKAGTFKVTLTITDNDNATATSNQNVTVTKPNNTNKGTISGSISILNTTSVPPTSSSLIPKLQSDSDSYTNSIGWQYHPDAEFVAGEIVVKFKEAGLKTAQLSLSSNQYNISHVRTVAGEIAELYRNSSLDQAATLALAKELNQRDDILYASPNYIMKIAKVPNDEFYKFQWHYPIINLPQAWDLTTGSANTVVAVVDTGILADANNSNLIHPDFVGKVLPGYDFISDPRSARDGDGRDPNPLDEGDNALSFHGSHVAGTVAAATNNTIGVAGVNWKAKILPVRVLGFEGGSIVDIAEGTLWAAGLHPNIANPNPASILNLSIQGKSNCPPLYQEVFDTIVAAGKIVVASAGNFNEKASEYAPGNCRGVISVGAIDLLGARAPYSNFGSRIDIMAPGGDTSVDLNNDNFIDGVLSTVLSISNNQAAFDYSFLQGTSMASPHVAGVISLMKALKPDLTPTQALSVITSTAKPLSAAQCNSSGCGAGLIDAFAALQLVKNGNIGGKGVLSFNPQLLDFGSKTQELDLTLRNSGDGNLKYSLSHFLTAEDNPADVPTGIISLESGAASGDLSKGQSITIRLGVDRDVLSATGLYQLGLVFIADNGQTEEEVFLLVRVTKPKKAIKLSGPMAVVSLIESGNNDLKESGFQISQGVLSNYKFDALVGENYVIAWSDENKNSEIDTGDFVGIYPNIVNVLPGKESKGIDIVLGPYTSNDLSTQQIAFLENFK